MSPTCFNIQHWRFVLVQDPEIRKEIRADVLAWQGAKLPWPRPGRLGMEEILIRDRFS